MFFKNLFSKSETYLHAEIIISKDSRINIISKSNAITDKEFILFGLLVYAKILRIENSKEEKEFLVGSFSELHKIYQKKDNSIDFKEFNENLHLKSKWTNWITITKDLKTKVKLKKMREGNFFYLDMGALFINPYASAVYTTYLYIWNNIQEKNRIHLFNSFLALSRFQLTEDLTSQTVVSLPNFIVSSLNDF